MDLRARTLAQFEVTNRNDRTQHLVHVRQERRPMPPQWVLDRAADEKLYGGYTAKQRKNVCPDCFEVRSLNGTCSC